jgi:hypothetical protein
MRADIHIARAALAEIGEPEAALLVEHQIVWPASDRCSPHFVTTVSILPD